MSLEILVNTGFNQPNRSLDLLPDESFSLNYSIADVQNIADTNGSFSESLVLPNTKNNMEIFGFISDMSVDLGYNYYNNNSNSFNPNKKVKCWVLEDSLVIIEGYIQLTDFTIDGMKNNTTINATIYADNTNFFNAMGDKLLTDLDFSEYSFTYSQALIQSTWHNDIDAYTKGYYFPLIDTIGLTLDDVNNETIYQIGIKDFKPAVFIKTIWDKIFSSLKTGVISKFTGSNNKSGANHPDPRFGNLIIPYNQITFQTGSTYSSDKVYYVGLSQSTLGEYSAYEYSQYGYIAVGYPSMASPPRVIVNATTYLVGGVLPDSTRYMWYTGSILSPWQFHGLKNTANSATDAYGGTDSSIYMFDTKAIPFNSTTTPLFNTFVNSDYTYNDSSYYYQNRTNDIFKQRFVLNTDVVTTFSFDSLGGIDDGLIPYFRYVMKVDFYREFDPSTGVASPDWASGTGVIIPPDLGGAESVCVNINDTVADSTFWICDKNGKSNVFDKSGTLIVPFGENRYLGKYCTNERGDKAVEADSSSAMASYRFKSGDCVAMYDNNGDNQTSPDLVGLYTTSNYSNDDGYSSADMATGQPRCGDWYQQLQLQTIFLDGDVNNPKYGASGTIQVNGNKPIYPNERVRVVVSFGSKYFGQQYQSSHHQSYIAPVSAYLLTSSNFANDAPYPSGPYQHPMSTNQPLSTWYNDVSNDYIEGQFVDFNSAIPKNIKCKDFIQDIVRMHNLYIEPSKEYSNTLIIEPRDDYYKLGKTSLDWSNKLDTSSINVRVLAETQNKRTLFSYKPDNDYYNKTYTVNTNECYGQYTYDIDNDYLTGTKNITSIFSPTPVAALYSSVGEVTPLTIAGAFILPVLVNGANVNSANDNGPANQIQTNYRILIKKYLENQNSDTIKIFGESTHSYPYAGPYDNPYSPRYTINWGQTKGEFIPSDTIDFSVNLVNMYWANLLTELTDMDSRIITCSMLLNAKDINDFYFYKLVFLSINGVDGYYKVNSIEGYNPDKNSLCKVTLLRSNSFLPTKIFS